MPRNRLDGIKTKDGRVVYDRKPHAFTAKDLERVMKKVLAGAADQSPEKQEKIFWVIAKAVDEISEQLLEKILTLVGLEGYGDEALEVMQAMVQSLVNVFVRNEISIEFPKEHVGVIPPVRM